MKKGVAFINSRFVPIEKAALSILDLTVQRGYGVNEVFRTYGRKPFLLREHLDRLRNSEKLMRMKNCPSEALLRRVVARGVKKIRGESLIKILITAGPGRHITPIGHPELIVYFLPFHGHPASDFARGFRMMAAEHLRALPSAKSLDYFHAILAQQEAEARGYDEAIFRNGDRILEGTTFNIAVIRGSQIIAPRKDVLKGTTMEATLKIAPRAGLRVVRRDITFADLRKADEMISTSTIREILAVVAVDNIKIGNSRPGPYAKKLLEEFRRYAAAHAK